MALSGRARRILLATLGIAVVAVTFWSGSRVPALNEKVRMGTATGMSGIGFDVVVVPSPADPLWQQIAYHSLNWMATNRQGMTFGVLFAAAVLTLFCLLRTRSFEGKLANSGLGMVVGMPLGVCVNCAAPIAQGLLAGGARAETAVAAMLSSPTLNVIVLTMLFALFPWYVAALKVGLTLVFILVAVPLITRRAPAAAPSGPVRAASKAPEVPCEATDESLGGDGWLGAAQWFAVAFARNLWFILRKTVPLMLLAGVLGAALITIFPWDRLAGLAASTSGWSALLGMTGLAVVGVFFPVPMSFDVIVSAALLEAGVPIEYVMVLLFTLGIYSVYPYFIISNSLSRRIAATMFVSLVAFGVAGGVLAGTQEDRRAASNRAIFFELMTRADQVALPQEVRRAANPSPERDGATATPRGFSAARTTSSSLQVVRTPFAARERVGDAAFLRLEGRDLGVDVPHAFSFFQMELPFVMGHGRAVSSGDWNGDGWNDLAITSDGDLWLFENLGGRFRRVPGPQLPGDPSILYSALVDLDGDGALDLFLPTLTDGDFVAPGRDGRFASETITRLPSHAEDAWTSASGFADLDRDGDLDIVLGRWSPAWAAPAGTPNWTWISSTRSHDVALWNEAGGFRLERLDTPPGAPTSILLSDLDDDRRPDLVIGNDFGPSDLYYLDAGSPERRPLTPEDGIVSHTTSQTMSVSVADVNNDLSNEIYLGDISRHHEARDYEKPMLATCGEIRDPGDRGRCEQTAVFHAFGTEARRRRNAAMCAQIEDPALRDECTLFYFVRRPHWLEPLPVCQRLPGAWRDVVALCRAYAQEPYIFGEAEQERQIHQTADRNVLLERGPDGRFQDRAEERGLHVAGWTWNARFADLDLDGWTDLFVANGSWRSTDRRESNYFLRNEGEGHFVDRTEEYGLGSHFATSSYSYVDLDADGDLDLVVVPQSGPVGLYLNQAATGNAAVFGLRDEQGNRLGIGSTVIVHYGPNGKLHQRREIEASGGFISYDPPRAHFGLGEHDEITRIEILWSTGERSELPGPFPAGFEYRIRRPASPVMAERPRLPDDSTTRPRGG